MIAWFRGRRVAAILLPILLCGCAPLDFGAHASFDSWFVGSADSLHFEEWGILALDGGPGGTLVNDILIRTPALIVQDATCLLLTPVALPYYWICSLTGGGEAPPPSRTPDPSATEGKRDEPGQHEGLQEPHD
jgi:hypothetical protein